MRPRLLIATALVGVGALALSTPASAHTESDVVAVPAGGATTVTLKPTHGCGDSPTVEVAIRAPVAGAMAGAVDGWTATQTADREGNTVLEWKGGVLPSTEVGAFPVSFTAPGAVGDLLTFPSIQTCENGESLPWIDGDPEGDRPAPRLLILPPGSEPAATIEDVPADAAGRDQLTSVVDVDNPAGPDEGSTTTAPTTSSTAPADRESAAEEGKDEGASALPLLMGAAVVVLGGVAVWMGRRRST